MSKSTARPPHRSANVLDSGHLKNRARTARVCPPRSQWLDGVKAGLLTEEARLVTSGLKARALESSAHSEAVPRRSGGQASRHSATRSSRYGSLIFRVKRSIGAYHVPVGFNESGDRSIDRHNARSIDEPRNCKRRPAVKEGKDLVGHFFSTLVFSTLVPPGCRGQYRFDTILHEPMHRIERFRDAFGV